MHVSARKRLFCFANFTLDPQSGELWNSDQKIPLQEKPFQLLVTLLEKPGEVVTREELRERLWPADTFVDFEHSINTAIKKIREALGDSGGDPKFVQTLPRRGYRFIAHVQTQIEDLGEADSNVIAVSTSESIPGRPKARGLKLAAAVSAFAMILVVLGAFFIVRSVQSRQEVGSSVAVLPFNDLSPAQDQAYFSEGLSEEVQSHLTKIPNLRVVARTSASQFKGRNQDPKLIGQKLNVATLLDGSVQKVGDHVRVSAHLTRASTGISLWSESYDRDFKDIFAVEDDIAKSVTSALQLKLLTGNRQQAITSSGTTMPEAFEAFLHARYFRHMYDKESSKKALEYANKAVLADPKYASAYALRANIALDAGGALWMDWSQVIASARQDAEKALALDPNLPDGYRVLGQIQAMVESNCPAAQTSLKRALELAPGDPDNLEWAGWTALCMGQLEPALKLIRQEQALDPLRPFEYLLLSQILLDMGNPDQAHAMLSKALELNPKEVMIHEIACEAYLAQGRVQEAVSEIAKEPDKLYRNLGESLAYHALERKKESDSALAQLIAEHAIDGAYQIAQVYGFRNEADGAFEWLERSYRQHDPGLMNFKTDPKFNALRADLRYREFLKKLNQAE